MNNKQRKKTTFPREIVFYLLISIFGGALLFFALFFCNQYLYKTVIQPNMEDRDFEEASKEFQNFVTTNGADSNGKFTWQASNGTVFFMRNDSDFQNQPDFHKGNEKTMGQRAPLGTEKSKIITYSDDKVKTTFLIVENRWPFYLGIVCSILLSLGLTLLVFYRQLLRKAKYMHLIENGTFILESGNLEHQIPELGNDELSQIATSINRMSHSLSEKIVSEAKATQASREIISDLSHDIRTPLTILTGYLPVLLETDLTEEQRKYLELIHKKTKQMNTRVNDLLEYATIFSGQQPLELQDIEIHLLLEQLIIELLPITEVEHQLAIPPKTTIVGDIQLLERLFDNLISNINQHAAIEQGVSITAEIKGEYVQVVLQNQIGESVESFGKSLGVKIASMIAELHGGKLQSVVQGNHYVTRLELPIKKRGKK